MSQPTTTGTEHLPSRWKLEAPGLLVLAGMVVYFLRLSWRRWPDPLVDAGLQWYAAWLVSLGALPYHDFVWNYGPLSLCFNAALFKLFGPGMMVLVAANLVIYVFILALGYAAFRIAWGPLGAFTAAAVFVSVFSFSHLTSVGNYNFATPYANESTHGMLLMLVTVFVAARWCRRESRALAFLLGLCGGLATVIKPEFMLAGAVLGLAAVALRLARRQAMSPVEGLLIAAGMVLPTAAFALWFARVEPWKTAFIDASKAWWLVVVEQVQRSLGDQENFSGFDHPWLNTRLELKASLVALGVVAAVWAAGWLVNRSWSWSVRLALALGAGALVCFARLDGGWFMVGRCFPVLTLIALALVFLRLRRESRQGGGVSNRTIVAFLLLLLAATMLARMPLRARVYHFGFFQAAFAGMAVAAVLVTEVPAWTGAGRWGRCVTRTGLLILVAAGCCSIAGKSRGILADQTEPVGTGRDRFYAFNGEVDETGALVNWVVNQAAMLPADASLLVLPQGTMINYLARRRNPLPAPLHGGGDEQFLDQLRRTPPDYVVLLERDPRQYGYSPYGTPGSPGRIVVQWLAENYTIYAAAGGDPLVPGQRKAGATIVRRK